MTWLRLGASELRKLTAGSLPKLAVLAIALIPTLYAGLYLFANFDPYDRLGEVPAALVVQDRGVTVEEPETGETRERDLGREVADELLEGGGFGWVETDEATAEEGMRSGRFNAALIIGETFSADLASVSDFEPRQASLTLITNDANNYLAHTIAQTIVDQVRDSIAAQVGSEAADTFLRGFATVHTSLGDAVEGTAELLDGSRQLNEGLAAADDGAQQLAAGIATADDGVHKLQTQTASLPDAARRLDDGAHDLADGLARLRSATAGLPAQTDALADGALQVAEGNAALAGYADELGDTANEVLPAVDSVRRDVDTALESALTDLVSSGVIDQGQATDLRDAVAQDLTPTLDSRRAEIADVVARVQVATGQVDTLASGARQVAEGAERLAQATPQLSDGIAGAADGADRLASGTSELTDATPQLVAGVDQLADGTAQLREGGSELAAGTPQLVTGSARLEDGVEELHGALEEGLSQVPDLDEKTRGETADTIADPVQIHDAGLTSAGTYGAGLAPFFLSLATWIGAYVLFLLVEPLSRRALAAGHSAVATALGGWVVPAAIGVLQVALMFAVVKFALDITPVHGVGTALFLALVSVTFVAILQALNAWLGAVGQFLGLVLMLLQLVTAGGTFPWQTIPEPLRSMHRFLPMTYAVEGLRQLLYGGSMATVWRDVAVLLAGLVAALTVTAMVVVRRRVWTVSRLQPELVL